MAWMAATTAAQRRQKLLAEQAQEEEDMTNYAQDDLKDDWEFKIVRSDTSAFRRPEVLNRLLEEEARAGWVMLEKLDDSRVRLKRPRSARSRDAYLPPDVDPYRTQYGATATRRAVLASVLLGVVLLAGLVSFLMVEGFGGSTGTPIIAMLIPLILVVLGFVMLLARRQG